MASFTKRKSLRDQLDRISTLDDETANQERFELLEELEADVETSKDYRWHAPKTQNRQDYHLELYKRFVLQWYKGLSEEQIQGMNEDEESSVLFPDDDKTMAHLLNLYLVHVFKRAVPRAKRSNTILLRTLVQYRNSMLFWVGWHYRKREKEWSHRKLYNAMTQSIRYVQDKYGDSGPRVEKTWLGLAELRQLLDFEAFNNRSIELSEQHQVLWCIGHVTALRPGSLCPSGKFGRTKPLTWRDLEFTKGDERGQFNVRMNLERLDIKHPSDPTVATTGALLQPFAIRIKSPDASNLLFSPAHRLLVMALRRGILSDINSLDELLDDPREVISIAPAHLDDWIFYAGKPKGESLDYNKAMQAHALTEYLQRRGYAVGFTNTVTWYSIRRRAATDMARRIGMQATRLFLGHSPDSQALELYYLQMTSTLDNMGILTDQGVEVGGHSSKDAENWAPLALNKLEDGTLQHMRTQALAQLTRRLIMADPDGPSDTSSQGLKNYRRNARRVAQQQLVQAEAEKQRTSISKEDMDARRAGLKASSFADHVLRNAVGFIQGQGRESDETTAMEQDDEQLDDPEDEEGRNYIGDEELVQQTEPEPDFEEMLTNYNQDVDYDASGAVNANVDEGPSGDDTNDPTQIDYARVARSMMELLLDNTLTGYSTWAESDKRCPVCQDDETVSDEQKAKEHLVAKHLEQHLQGNFHHPVSKWKRHVEIHYQQDRRFFCPYFQDSNFQSELKYRNLNKLIDHVISSNVDNTNLRHDELKEADGWYTEDFKDARKLPEAEATTKAKAQRGIKNLKAAGIEFNAERELLAPEPYKDSNTIVRGSHPDAPLPTRYHPFIETGTAGSAAPSNPIPAHLQGFVGIGYSLTPTNPLPSYMKGEVVVSRFPRSAEDADEEMGDV